MDKKLSEYIYAYKSQMEIGDIQVAYEKLVKYVMTLKAHFEKYYSDKYSFGNVSPGYMDFTYFPFFDAFLRSERLRFGIVLNHSKMRFELWLMGQNAETQKTYWDLLKDTVWNRSQSVMPKYSVFEAVLVEVPNFDDMDTLTSEIVSKANTLSDEITSYIKSTRTLLI